MRQVLWGEPWGGTLSLRRRDFSKHSKMDLYTRGGKESYWINEHRRACFAFPDECATIFESTGSGQIALTAQSRFSSLFKAISLSVPLRQSLTVKGLLAEESGTIWMGVGAGRYTNQLRCSWPANFPLHA